MSTAEQQEAQANEAAVNQAAMERVNIWRVATAVNGLRSDRQSNPRASITPAQAKKHRDMLKLAVHHKFIRHSPAWMDYMASAVGQYLEDCRWVGSLVRKEESIACDDQNIVRNDKNTIVLE